MVKIAKRPYKKGRKEKTLIARIDYKIWKDIKLLSVQNDSTMTDIIEDSIIAYLHLKQKRLTSKDKLIE